LATLPSPLRHLLGRASSLTLAIHPYHRDFIVDFPAGDVRDGDDRWAWITLEDGMWHRWARLPSDERRRLVTRDFAAIVKGDFGRSPAELDPANGSPSAHRPLTLRRARLVGDILLSWHRSRRAVA
jgi:hypothetical protein